MPSAASGEARAASGPEGYADLPLFYYPGYRAVSADGGQLPVIRSEDGLARVLFAGGDPCVLQGTKAVEAV